MMSGDKTGMNVYLRVKSGDKAFKLSFADDGLVYFGGQSTGYEYSASKWYRIDFIVIWDLAVIQHRWYSKTRMEMCAWVLI